MADEEEEICRTSKAHCKRSARVSQGKVGRSDSVMLLLSIDVSSSCSICKCNRGLTLAPLADGLGVLVLYYFAPGIPLHIQCTCVKFDNNNKIMYN